MMAEHPKKNKEIGRSKSLMSPRREMKSSTLPANARLGSPSGEGFFTKLKRCLRIGSKGRYNVNAMHSELLTHSPGEDKAEKKQNIVARATSLRLTRRAHDDKEEVILIHKAKMKSGNGVFPNRSVSETIPEDQETLVCIVNGDAPRENGGAVGAEAADDVADDVFEMDPGYETLDEIRRKVHLQELRAKKESLGVSEVVCDTDNVKPKDSIGSPNGFAPVESGQDSGITTPTTESPESGRDSQVRSVTSSIFSESALVEGGNSHDIDWIEPEEITMKNGIMHRLNSCPSDSMSRPHRDTHRYNSDSFLIKPLQDDTDPDLYANPQILFRKQSKMGQNKAVSASTITVHRTDPPPDQLDIPRGLGEKCVSEGDINPLRGSSVESDCAPPLPDRRYLACEARTSRFDTDDELSTDCSTSTTLSANLGLSQSHDSVVSINSMKEMDNVKTPDVEHVTDNSFVEELCSKILPNLTETPQANPDQDNSMENPTCENSSNLEGDPVSQSISLVETVETELSLESVVNTQDQDVHAHDNTQCDNSAQANSENQIMTSSSEQCAQDSGSDSQTSDGCENVFYDKKVSHVSQAGSMDEECEGVDVIERRSEQSCDNVVMLKLHESAHEDSFLLDDSEEGVSDFSMARLEKKVAKLQLGVLKDIIDDSKDTDVSKDEEPSSVITEDSKADAIASSSETLDGDGTECSASSVTMVAGDTEKLSKKRKIKEEPIHMSLAELMKSETEDGSEADENDYEDLTDDETEDDPVPEPAPPPTTTCSNPIADYHRAFLESMRQLKDCGWYWGPLSYSEAIAKLSNKPDGSFLVRDSSNDSYILSLSFKCLGTVCHTRIEHQKGIFSFWSQPDSHGRATIKEFIEQAVKFSHTGKFLYFLRPSGPGSPPIPIRLLYPLSRFCRVQSLQHMCRFLILRWVRRDHIDVLPVPEKVKNYLRENQYYVETLDED